MLKPSVPRRAIQMDRNGRPCLAGTSRVPPGSCAPSGPSCGCARNVGAAGSAAKSAEQDLAQNQDAHRLPESDRMPAKQSRRQPIPQAHDHKAQHDYQPPERTPATISTIFKIRFPLISLVLLPS